jgi:multisubunit Na+/H+ antiporter MnhC subunit
MDSVDRDLERQIHDALRALPEPRAPRSLAPRVMQAVAAVSAARGGWRQWPLAWQLLGLVAACSAAGALALAIPLTSAWLANLEAARAAAVLWQTFVAPIATPALVLTAVMIAASALLVAALKHVAWEGQESSHP